MCKHLTLLPVVDKIAYQPQLAALIADGLRRSASDGANHHGTGIGFIKNGKFAVNKSGESALSRTMADSFSSDLMELDLMHYPVMGHVRRASQSFIAKKDEVYPDEDAHPFIVGSIMLAHNGTITNYEDLVKEHALTEGKIDSYAVAEMLARGKDLSLAALNSVTEQLEGGFALVIQHIDEPNKVIFCSHLKPLFLIDVVARDNDGDKPDLAFLATGDDAIRSSIATIEQASYYITGVSVWSTYSVNRVTVNKWYMWDRSVYTTSEDIVELGKVEWKPTTVTAWVGGVYNANAAKGDAIADHRVGHGSGYAGISNTAKEKRAAVIDATTISDVISKFLIEVLPLTVGEFRQIYAGLNQRDLREGMQMEEVTSTIAYLKHVLEEKSRYKYLESFFGIMIIPSADGDDKFVIVRERIGVDENNATTD